jgi:hypothetical protein
LKKRELQRTTCGGVKKSLCINVSLPYLTRLSPQACPRHTQPLTLRQTPHSFLLSLPPVALTLSQIVPYHRKLRSTQILHQRLAERSPHTLQCPPSLVLPGRATSPNKFYAEGHDRVCSSIHNRSKPTVRAAQYIQ